MSILKGRRSSVLKFDMENRTLIIEDHLRAYRVIQIVLLISSVFGCALILLKEKSSFWLGLLIGSFIALALFAIYYYLFKSSVQKSIPLEEIEILISISLFSVSDKRLTIKLKSEGYRNLITLNQSEVDHVIESFNEASIPVVNRSNFSLLPLNF
ncbi:hypothetical protein FNJ87_04115 [Nonlabens mediterrranea]|uniref:Uncharacterized protein n=1 Tax=Nonlabens mediterrranea TaxID=1419947 RepID=A0ABS0A4J1_9FLAO|nr:hypothetical protein [Nonlabens mediterrranea]